jgi:hypothetical protein
VRLIRAQAKSSSRKRQALKLQAASIKPQAASVKLQAASYKLPNLQAFIKFQAQASGVWMQMKVLYGCFTLKRNLVW